MAKKKKKIRKWETIIDFTKIKKSGIHVDEILKRLEIKNSKHIL